ncbi:MAG: hypothetical protein B9S33_02030 [Pedosphaera sp. Tous-C6FEB]|nr:MAG: hypothetical protein B9S33_02030 [Pedosphaera sp. Tous-C6FEB]
MRRWAIAHQLAHPSPAPRPPASVRRWQCLKIGALWQLDATPHRWFPGDQKHYPLLDLLDDCSRVCTGATIYHGEDLLAYFDFLPAAFTEHGLPLELYVDCHSFFFPQRPDALTLEGMKPRHVIMLRALGLKNHRGDALRNDSLHYTLNHVPKE